MEKKQSLHSLIEQEEFLKIAQWFPHAKIKSDYNREILDIGAELPVDDKIFILLKGDQTNHDYEVITPECKCIEGLQTMAEVFETITKLTEKNVDIGQEMTREKGRNE